MELVENEELDKFVSVVGLDEIVEVFETKTQMVDMIGIKILRQVILIPISI